LLLIALYLLTVSAARGQAPQPADAERQSLGPSADSIQPYRPPSRDPFRRNVKPKTKLEAEKQKMIQLGFPAFQTRQVEFQQKVDAALRSNLPEPDPFTQYLVDELDVTGIFRDQQGMGAFLRAQPTGRMFFVRAGARCYNGEVMRIDGDDADAGGAKVLFRRVTYMEVNGKRAEQQSVVTKTPANTPKSGSKG
jgi:hypothetical protein